MAASTPPSLPLIYLRAALGFVTKKHSLSPEMTRIPSALIPEETLQFTIDPKHVKFFQSIVHSTPSTTTDTLTRGQKDDKDNTETRIVPITYVQCILNSMPMNLLTHRQFPLNIVGSVHESTKLETRKALYLHHDNNTKPLSLMARCKLLPEIARSDKNDWIFSTVTDIDYASPSSSSSSTDDLTDTTKSIMTITNEFRILNPQRNKMAKSQPPPPADDEDYLDDTIWEPMAQWEFPVDTGRRYAVLNGDINPIHLFPLTAKIFGYKSCIAHGMYSVCKLTEEHPRLVDTSSTSSSSGSAAMTTTVTARFTRPILLPNKTIRVFLKRGTDDYVIGTRNEKDGQLKAAVKGKISLD